MTLYKLINTCENTFCVYVVGLHGFVDRMRVRQKPKYGKLKSIGALSNVIYFVACTIISFFRRAWPRWQTMYVRRLREFMAIVDYQNVLDINLFFFDKISSYVQWVYSYMKMMHSHTGPFGTTDISRQQKISNT